MDSLPPPNTDQNLAELQFNTNSLFQGIEPTMSDSREPPESPSESPEFPPIELLHSSPPPAPAVSTGAYRYSPSKTPPTLTPDISADITRHDLAIFIRIKGQKPDSPISFSIRDRTSQEEIRQSTLFPNRDGFCALMLKKLFTSLKEGDRQRLDCIFTLFHKDLTFPLADLSNQNILSIETHLFSSDFNVFIESKLHPFTLLLIGASENDLKSHELWVFHPHCTSPHTVEPLPQSTNAITINALPGSTLALVDKSSHEIVASHPLERFHLTRTPGIFFNPAKKPEIKLGSLFPICILRIKCALPKKSPTSLLNRVISFKHTSPTGEITEFGRTALAYLQVEPPELGEFTSNTLAERGSVFTIELNESPIQRFPLPADVEKLFHTLSIKIDESGEATILDTQTNLTTA